MGARSSFESARPERRAHRVACATGLAVAFAACVPAALAAQSPAPEPARDTLLSLVEAPAIGSDLEARSRLRQIVGIDSTAGFLTRSLSSRLTLPASADSVFWRVLAPELYAVGNSAFPFSQNDGALWAGRGPSVRLSAGVAASWGPLRVILAPELLRSKNSGFEDVDETRWWRPAMDLSVYSPWASPWHRYPFSLDGPERFGDGRLTELSPGQSSLWGEWGSLAVGVSAENLWWGPGIHDALVMTNNAGGVPHAFVRTARPVRTGVGDFEGRWLVGKLSESDYFDLDSSNDTRSLAAAVVTWRPRWEPDLTVGVARAVFAATDESWKVLGRWTDVWQPGDRPNSRPWSDDSYTGGRDGLTSLFARWVFPSQGGEVYTEIGRAERPASLRDFLAAPNHTMAYILGGQLARPFDAVDGHWRIQAEFLQNEQTPTYRYRPTHSWYSSRATPQGYTQRGQVIGATVGPGSSHQLLAADVIAPTWSAGVFATRWRRNTDMWFTVPYPWGTGSCEYDTMLSPGVRGSYRWSGVGMVRAEMLFTNRLNAWNQNNGGCPEVTHARDVRNTTLRLWVTPLVF
ncbi:MAG TPA: hypothetical protein VGE02_05985 [Gemmatimonadales bacterium]